jgi:hypothetical protein
VAPSLVLHLSGPGCEPGQPLWAVRGLGCDNWRRACGRSGCAAGDGGARLFGPIEVAAGGRRLGPRDLGGPKAKQVLELLLVARGHNVTKERLADQL